MKALVKINIILAIAALLIASISIAQELTLKDGLYYKKGMLYSGVYNEYYPNDTLKSKSQFKSGVLDGISTFYFDNGKIKEQSSYSNGNKDGAWIEWNINGVKIAEANYKNNKKTRQLVYLGCEWKFSI